MTRPAVRFGQIRSIARLVGLVLRAVPLLVGAWSTYQLLAGALEWWRGPSPVGIPDNGYPNEWGVRTTPLEAAELERHDREVLERRLAELG